MGKCGKEDKTLSRDCENVDSYCDELEKTVCYGIYLPVNIKINK